MKSPLTNRKWQTAGLLLVLLTMAAGLAWARGKWQGWRGFAKARGSELFEFQALNELLDRNEVLIREAQGTGAPDWYWRMYFLLTRSGAK